MNNELEVSLPKHYCITTITCDQFAIGTEVLLHSLLKYNPWFNGDINIVIAELSTENRERLLSIYPITFIQASDILLEKVSVLRKHFNYLKDIHLRFFSLEAFNQPEYDKVVYLDSDMVCAGDIKPLFESTAPLLACLDGFSYEDRIATIVADVGLSLESQCQRYGKHFKNSFNAGVISITPSKLPKNHFQHLVDMLDYQAWLSYGDSIFTDQMVINRYFENQIDIISSEYNYMIFLGSYLDFIDDIAPHQAKIIHFAGKIKPWNNYHQDELIACASDYLPFIYHWRTLLNESRNRRNPHYNAQKLLDQYKWIEQGADHKLKATDRLF